MLVMFRRFGVVAGGVLLVALAACQGNIGSGLPITPQQQGPYGQPGGPGAPVGPQSTERKLDGAVYLTPDLSELPLPTLDGYGIAIALGATPPPSPSPTASPSAGASASPAAAGSHARRLAAASVRASASPAPSPSPTASADPSATPSAAATSTASPGAKASARPKVATSIVIAPSGEPAAPSPAPTGNVQTFVTRAAIVRGSVQAATDVPLFGLGAVRFTLPATETTASRGFTIALFESGKKRHERLIAYDASATAANGIVSSSLVQPLLLKKGVGYDLVLYGDLLPSTPAPVASGYATPGINPFPTPQPSGFPTYAPTSPYGPPTLHP
jgi:hypothetical protein